MGHGIHVLEDKIGVSISIKTGSRHRKATFMWLRAFCPQMRLRRWGGSLSLPVLQVTLTGTHCSTCRNTLHVVTHLLNYFTSHRDPRNFHRTHGYEDVANDDDVAHDDRHMRGATSWCARTQD